MSFLETLADKFFHAFYQKDWPGENESTLDKLFIAEALEIIVTVQVWQAGADGIQRDH